jgi:hypothetical protein
VNMGHFLKSLGLRVGSSVLMLVLVVFVTGVLVWIDALIYDGILWGTGPTPAGD